MDAVTWYYQGLPFNEPTEGQYGFVYQITNLVNNKHYIGKKLFWFKKTRIVKGKRKRYLTESDWRSYYGSSKTLLEDVKAQGYSNFRRDILYLCKNKGECSYYEAKTQFDRQVLLSPEDFYNDWIICRIHRKHLA